jgi:hypothetical protein
VSPRRYHDGWFKVSRRITGSSLWAEHSDVLKVWLYLLEQAQAGTSLKPGTVIISRPILASHCMLSLERLDFAIERLASPDPESRTLRKEGRRIEVLPNGFRLVNHGEYHDVVADEARSKARSHAGRLGGLRSGESRKLKANQSDSHQQNATIDEPKRTETENETETENGSARATESPRPAWTGNHDLDAVIAETYRALREMEELTGEDPTAVMLETSGAGGKGRPVPRPELLREPALSLTLRDIQRRITAAKARQPSAPLDPHLERGW